MFGVEVPMISSKTNVAVVGAGRMGLRHCNGVLDSNLVNELFVVDINETALLNAKEQLKRHVSQKISYFLIDDFLNQNLIIETIILSSTAGDRIGLSNQLLKFSTKYFLVEKPLGQSMEEVTNLLNFFEDQKNCKVFVNLNTRLYPSYIKLKNDLKSLNQFNGPLTISINTGTVGIGANGIHYIDLIMFLTDATQIRIKHASIDDFVIPSGRGKEFGDFGGYAILEYLNSNNEILANAHLILGSQTTVLGPWEIVGPNGRILIDEFEQTRFNKYRKADSDLPVNRYAGDYLPIETEVFEIPFLNDLTKQWFIEVNNGVFILPTLSDTKIVHRTMFDWLNHSSIYKNKFPIT